MTTLELQADMRDQLGGGTARNLIRSGKVPAIVYGFGQENLSVAVEAKAIDKLFKSGCLTSTVIDLTVENKVHKTLVKYFQLDPVKDTIRHLDLIFINPEAQNVDVPLAFEGKERSLGVKRGGFFNIIHRKLKISAPIAQIPQRISVNVVEMRVGSKLLATDIVLPEGCSLAVKPDTLIANIIGRGKGGAEEKAE